MKLVVFNGSPRTASSNSKILIENFLKGYKNISNQEVEVFYLAQISKQNQYIENFRQAETILLIFPLYTDCMPFNVKNFFELLYKQKFERKNVGFIVQSGFPEAHHSFFVEKYLKKFTSSIGCNYLGTVIKGGVEGMQMMPPSMTKKLFGQFQLLGKKFTETGTFDKELTKKMATPIKMSKINLFFFKIISKTGLTNYYWNTNLKKNNAFKNRFDSPYIK